jgi:ABC-2 type transport system ATP-binding protein
MLTVNNLKYQYGPHVVLSDLALQLEQRTVAILVGRNGAGKSTLLRCLAGWLQADDGTIEINGVSLQRDERAFRQQVILVPDTPDFYDELTAWEHLQLTAQLHRVPDWQPQAVELLQRFHLSEHRTAFPFTFSRGMRYKLALCLALLVNPPLLLLDEPFGPLDAPSVHYLWEMLQAYRDVGRSVLFSSHALPAGEQPDKILFLQNQQVTLVDPATIASLAGLLDDA